MKAIWTKNNRRTKKLKGRNQNKSTMKKKFGLKKLKISPDL